MRISKYVDELNDQNLIHLIENMHLCPESLATLKTSLREENPQKQRLKKSIQTFEQTQTQTLPTPYSPFLVKKNTEQKGMLRSLEDDHGFDYCLVLNSKLRQQFRAALIQVLNQVQSVVQTRTGIQSPLPTPIAIPIPIIPCALVRSSETTLETKRLHKKRRKERQERKKPYARPEHMEATVNQPFVRQYTLTEIRESIEREIKKYKQRLEFKPGMTSVDRRKHSSVIKREFYKWYFDHITLFMDGYLFPHKELRKTFENQLANLSEQQTSPLFLEQDLRELSQVLNSFITQDIALSDTKQTKIRNLIIHLGILFRSFLDFLSCLQSEGDFNSVKTQWIQSLSGLRYNQLGKSTLDLIEKSLQQYKFH